MKILFFGTPDFVLPVLESLEKHFSVIGVITGPDHIAGRKKVLTPSPVKQFAIDHKLQTILTPDKLNQETTEQIASLASDLFVVAAYGKIIPQAILDLPKYGAVNIHPSLLPKYRGPSPIQSTLLAGDSDIGLSIIKMDKKMDHGPLLYQRKIPLEGTETFASLHQSLFHDAASILPEVIQNYVSGDLVPVEQDDAEATFCHMITKESGYIDSENPPDQATIDRMIRAFYPWPTAWTKWRMANGEWRIVKLLPEGKLQLEGGKPTSIKDVLNGHPEMEILVDKMGLRT